jgi:phosphosulfolactate synthase (CoM biosynthesis protein A)
MIVDQGMPLGFQADLLALAADYADLAKIKTGSTIWAAPRCARSWRT